MLVRENKFHTHTKQTRYKLVKRGSCYIHTSVRQVHSLTW